MKYRNRICVDYDVDKMIPELNSEVGLSIPKNYSLLQGFVDRFEKNESIWPVVTHIHKYAKIGLLTNMYPHMFRNIEKKGILPSVQWDSVLDSSVLKLQKPDKELFAYAEKETYASGKEILFIDNQEGHVSAAKQFGWQTFLYDSTNYEQSSKLLRDFFDHIRIL
jgi:HAD superfamily hydrolase (TIGR01509 family)